MKNRITFALALACALWTGAVSAANVSASMTVSQAGGTSWQEDISSLIAQLNDDLNYGNPDVYYVVSAINNSAQLQTYTFTIGSAITPVSDIASIYADFSGSLTGRRGSTKTIAPVLAGGIQRVELSSDNGQTFVDAGVTVGQGGTFSASSGTLGLDSASHVGSSQGPAWNYLRLVSTFTLTGNTVAALAGYASVTPVPELDEAIMLLAGLAVVGSVARLRRRTLAA